MSETSIKQLLQIFIIYREQIERKRPLNENNVEEVKSIIPLMKSGLARISNLVAKINIKNTVSVTKYTKNILTMQSYIDSVESQVTSIEKSLAPASTSASATNTLAAADAVLSLAPAEDSELLQQVAALEAEAEAEQRAKEEANEAELAELEAEQRARENAARMKLIANGANASYALGKALGKFEASSSSSSNRLEERFKPVSHLSATASARAANSLEASLFGNMQHVADGSSILFRITQTRIDGTEKYTATIVPELAVKAKGGRYKKTYKQAHKHSHRTRRQSMFR